MRIAFSLFLAVLSLSVIPFAQNAPDAIPKDAQTLTDGFYYKNQQGWDRLQPISMAGGGMKHAGKMFVPGLTPQIVWTYRGAESPIQISERKPTFLVKELAAVANIAGRAERDLVIVRFDRKKDHRELQTTNGGNMFTFKAGLSKDRTPDITTRALSEGVFIVTVNQDLPSGEYLLTFGAMATSGYDFGIR
jgi:hypothetical protein